MLIRILVLCCLITGCQSSDRDDDVSGSVPERSESRHREGSQPTRQSIVQTAPEEPRPTDAGRRLPPDAVVVSGDGDTPDEAASICGRLVLKQSIARGPARKYGRTRYAKAISAIITTRDELVEWVEPPLPVRGAGDRYYVENAAGRVDANQLEATWKEYEEYFSVSGTPSILVMIDESDDAGPQRHGASEVASVLESKLVNELGFDDVKDGRTLEENARVAMERAETIDYDFLEQWNAQYGQKVDVLIRGTAEARRVEGGRADNPNRLPIYHWEVAFNFSVISAESARKSFVAPSPAVFPIQTSNGGPAGAREALQSAAARAADRCGEEMLRVASRRQFSGGELDLELRGIVATNFSSNACEQIRTITTQQPRLTSDQANDIGRLIRIRVFLPPGMTALQFAERFCDGQKGLRFERDIKPTRIVLKVIE